MIRESVTRTPRSGATRWAIAAAMVVLVAACGSAPAPSSTTTVTTVKWLIGIPAPSPGIPWMIAQELGYWRDEHLNVDVQYVNSGDATQNWQLVGNGQGEFTLGSPEPLVTGRAKGTPFGVNYVYNLVRAPIWYVMVNPDSSVSSFADLKGKTVGVNALGSPGLQFVQAGLKEAGLPADAANFAAIGLGPAMVQNLQNKRVDAIATFDFDTGSQMGRDGKLKVLPSPKIASSLLGLGILSNPDWEKAHPDVVAGFLRGVMKAQIFAENNRKATLQLFWKMYPQAKAAGVDDATAMEQALPILNIRVDEASLKYGEPKSYGQFIDASWKAETDFLGVADKVTTYSDFYTNTYAVAAAKGFNVNDIVSQAQNYKVN